MSTFLICLLSLSSCAIFTKTEEQSCKEFIMVQEYYLDALKARALHDGQLYPGSLDLILPNDDVQRCWVNHENEVLDIASRVMEHAGPALLKDPHNRVPGFCRKLNKLTGSDKSLVQNLVDDYQRMTKISILSEESDFERNFWHLLTSDYADEARKCVGSDGRLTYENDQYMGKVMYDHLSYTDPERAIEVAHEYYKKAIVGWARCSLGDCRPVESDLRELQLAQGYCLHNPQEAILYWGSRARIERASIVSEMTRVSGQCLINKQFSL